MPATVNTAHNDLNVPATSFNTVNTVKGRGAHRTHHKHSGITIRQPYNTQIERSCPAASTPRTTETECHIATDTVAVLGPPASDLPRSFVAHSPASSRPKDSVPSQACRAPRRQTIELPLSDDSVEKLVLQWDSALKLKAPEGEGALGLLL